MSNEKRIRIALAGNPNSGKTTLFNSLTGSTAYVGNWPGVTVEKRSGIYKNKKRGYEIEVVDLPGIYSMSPYTPEEVISRNYVLEEKPDVVVNIIDATNLERNLYLTTQLMEMDVPIVVALNMMDALEENGQTIDSKGLSKALGLPVVEISALRNRNLDDLMDAVEKAAKASRKGISYWAKGEDKDKIEKAKACYQSNNVSNPLFHAVKALEGDELESKQFPGIYESIQKISPETERFESESADERYQFITAKLSIYRKGAPKHEKKKLSRSDKIDKILTNKWAAIPIMLVILFLIFHIVFAGDLFYMHAMGLSLEDYPGFISFGIGEVNEAGEAILYQPFAGLFYDADGIVSIGEFLHRLAGDNETGILGCICLGIKAIMVNGGAPDWVIGFIYDGVLNGIAAVLGFLPQILLLFFFFSILEDSGYMARIAFVLDRIFRRFGVSGRAFLPMIMGFGCGVPAMINTRTLASNKERTKTIRVIPFFTCGAKAEFLVAIAAAVAVVANFDAGAFTFLIYLLGVVVALVSVVTMNQTTQREAVPPFIMELPAYHLPQFHALMIHVWDKAKHFVKKAFTIIFVSTVIVWAFTSFSWKWEFIPDSDTLTEADSILANLSMLIQPLFTPMGFGYNSGALMQYGWVYTAASIQGIVAKEAVTSTIEQLAVTIGGANAGFEDIVLMTGIGAPELTAFAVFNMLTIPCFASVATAKSELANRKAYLGTIFFWLGTSYVMGCLTFVTLKWVWTLAITLPVIAAAFVGLYFYNRHMNHKEATA